MARACQSLNHALAYLRLEATNREKLRPLNLTTTIVNKTDQFF